MNIEINFDESSRIRILDAVNYESSEKLKEECKDFTEKIKDFTGIVDQFVNLLNEKANEIKKAKLYAIGQRMKVETELENRKSKKIQLQTLIKERQNELERLTVQSDSLYKVQQEQNSFIDSFSIK